MTQVVTWFSVVSSVMFLDAPEIPTTLAGLAITCIQISIKIGLIRTKNGKTQLSFDLKTKRGGK